MGVTCELAPVLIRKFLHSYWSRATAGTVVPHHAICLGKIIKNQVSAGLNHYFNTSSPHIDSLIFLNSFMSQSLFLYFLKSHVKRRTSATCESHSTSCQSSCRWLDKHQGCMLPGDSQAGPATSAEQRPTLASMPHGGDVR